MLIEDFLLTFPENQGARALVDNVVRGNAFGLGGTDVNGFELVYDGNGTGNCFAGNTGVEQTIPTDGSTLAACQHPAANAFSQTTQNFMLSLAGQVAMSAWDKHPHPARPRFEPLELWQP